MSLERHCLRLNSKSRNKYVPHKIPDVTHRFRSPYRIWCASKIAVNPFDTKINRIYIEDKQCAYNVTCGSSAWSLLQWKRNNVYLLAACYCQQYENIACWKNICAANLYCQQQKNIFISSCTVPVFCRILTKLIFWQIFIQVCLIHADRETDGHYETKSAFRDYTNIPNNPSTRTARKSTLRFGYNNQLTYVV